jgi:hypothetical protein
MLFSFIRIANHLMKKNYKFIQPNFHFKIENIVLRSFVKTLDNATQFYIFELPIEANSRFHMY